jgi:hypothetical protein
MSSGAMSSGAMTSHDSMSTGAMASHDQMSTGLMSTGHMANAKKHKRPVTVG